jgi:hypothetical protein
LVGANLKCLTSSLFLLNREADGNSYVLPVSGAELGSANVGARWAGPLTLGAGFSFFCVVFSFFLVS